MNLTSCRNRNLTGHIGPWAFVMAILLTTGCQGIGGLGAGPGTTELQEGVVYQGFIEIDGSDLPAALEIIDREGRPVRGRLQASSGLTAEGAGRLRGRTLRLELTYGGDCPGRMKFEGEWNQDAQTYEGVLEASDCTGKGQGHFRFSGS